MRDRPLPRFRPYFRVAVAAVLATFTAGFLTGAWGSALLAALPPLLVSAVLLALLVWIGGELLAA